MAKKKKTAVPDDDLAILGGQNAVTYGPQINQVRDLLTQADEQYKTDIEAAKSNAASARSYATAAIPKVQGLFAKSTANAQGSANTVNELIGSPTGAPADVFARATAREQGNVRDRINESGTNAASDLQGRIVAAESGKQYAITQAKRDRAKTRDTLTTRLADILQEQGATSMATLAGLRGERSKAATKAESDQAKQDAKDAERRRKEAAEEAKRIKGVHTATGGYQNKITDAISDWQRYLTRGIEVKIADPDNPGSLITQTYDKDAKDPWGRPVKKGDPVFRKGTADDIRGALGEIKDDSGHLKYTPGDIHVALLRQANKPLDAAALSYLRNLRERGIRIPRAWLQPAYGGRAPGVTGPPTGRPTAGS